MAFMQQTGAQMRPQEAGTSGDQNAFARKHGNSTSIMAAELRSRSALYRNAAGKSREKQGPARELAVGEGLGYCS